jgi:hypothetical protein
MITLITFIRLLMALICSLELKRYKSVKEKLLSILFAAHISSYCLDYYGN